MTTEIRSFSVEISQEQIGTLRRRIEATRWPTTELVQDVSQGIQFAFSKSSRGTGPRTTTSGGSSIWIVVSSTEPANRARDPGPAAVEEPGSRSVTFLSL